MLYINLLLCCILIYILCFREGLQSSVLNKYNNHKSFLILAMSYFDIIKTTISYKELLNISFKIIIILLFIMTINFVFVLKLLVKQKPKNKWF